MRACVRSYAVSHADAYVTVTRRYLLSSCDQCVVLLNLRLRVSLIADADFSVDLLCY